PPVWLSWLSPVLPNFTAFRAYSMVEFLKYRNFSPFNPSFTLWNASFFNDCIFLTDEILPQMAKPTNFIRLWGVDVVQIYGCDFKNINPSASKLSDLGRGIYAQDASFISSGCINSCPLDDCCSPDEGKFINLSEGIQVEQNMEVKGYKVDKCIFENCRTGIANYGADQANIVRNVFDFGYTVDTDVSLCYGVFNNGGTHFKIEENTFKKSPQATSAKTIGTTMVYTGEDNNQIYKNTFEELFYANIAIGDNAATTANCDGTFNGLTYYCNQQSNTTETDILVYLGKGIRHYQGDLIFSTQEFRSAGNTFTNSGVHPASDISNSAQNNIIYIYDQDLNEEPLFFTPLKVQPDNPVNVLDHTCPSHFRSKDPADFTQDFNRHQSDLAPIEQSWEQQLDDGDTDALIASIDQAPVNDRVLKDQLEGISPYLSGIVINKLVDEQKFTGQDLLEILVANPDGLRQTNTIEKIENDQILPERMIDELKASAEVLTSRTSLEAQIVHHRTEKDVAARALMDHLLLLEDDQVTATTNDEILGYMESFSSLRNAYGKVDFLFGINRDNDALQLIGEIPNTFALCTKELDEYQKIRDLYTTMHLVKQQGRTPFDLNSTEYDLLDDLAEHGPGLAKVKARSILRYFYGQEYIDTLNIPASSRGEAITTASIGSEEKATPDQVKIAIQPNPASSYLRISYEAPSIYGNSARIEIYNSSGQLMTKQVIDQQELEINLNISDWPDGGYFAIYIPQSGIRRVIPLVVVK
ncbi:MAG: T9SS type A sorting domain-containing protein, partial [Bacteroidota bacterium]